MTCNQVNCAECLSLMAINNDVHGVEQYLQKLDHILGMYITFPRSNLQREIKEYRDIHKETSEAVEYLLRKDDSPEHRSFDASMSAKPEYWSRAVYPFSLIFLKCDWIKSEIRRVILKFIDPCH